MDIKGYDEWKLQAYDKEPKLVGLCEHCGDEIYEGEEVVFTIDDEIVHSDCFYDFACDVLMKFSGPAEVTNE